MTNYKRNIDRFGEVSGGVAQSIGLLDPTQILQSLRDVCIPPPLDGNLFRFPTSRRLAAAAQPLTHDVVHSLGRNHVQLKIISTPVTPVCISALILQDYLYCP